MNISHKILFEANRTQKDEFYYAANDVEQGLFNLKTLATKQETIDKIDMLIIELNNIRMEEYKEDRLVKQFIDLPIADFGAKNTIGELNDGRLFIVFDDEGVSIVNKKMSLNELRDLLYTESDDELNNFAEQFCTEADRDLANQIVFDIKRK